MGAEVISEMAFFETRLIEAPLIVRCDRARVKKSLAVTFTLG